MQTAVKVAVNDVGGKEAAVTDNLNIRQAVGTHLFSEPADFF